MSLLFSLLLDLLLPLIVVAVVVIVILWVIGTVSGKGKTSSTPGQPQPASGTAGNASAAPSHNVDTTAEMLRWLHNEAKHGRAETQELIDSFFNRDKFESSDRFYELFRKLVEEVEEGEEHLAADPEYQYGLAHAYRLGKGGPVDVKKAIKWFTKAAEEGNHHEAQAMLGLTYVSGFLPMPNGRHWPVVKDERKGERFLRMAAEQGYGEAQETLGAYYMPINEAEAVKWLRKAVAQGRPKAAELLRIMGY